MSVPEVYKEREPIYKKYSKFTLDGSKTVDELVDEAEKIYLNE